ncbi:MAG: tetratricopeptide repeat protein [Deltaproteobacteria bacterium]|nr:tetratricopeptide repeat protein [Deltaproteobacteria bacterium]
MKPTDQNKWLNFLTPWVVMFILAVLPSGAQAESNVAVNNIRFHDHAGFVRLVFDLSDRAPYQVEVDHVNNVIKLNFKNARFVPGQPRIAVNQGPVKDIQVTSGPDGRVQFQVAMKDKSFSATDYALAGPNRVVVDVKKSAQAGPVKPAEAKAPIREDKPRAEPVKFRKESKVLMEIGPGGQGESKSKDTLLPLQLNQASAQSAEHAPAESTGESAPAVEAKPEPRLAAKIKPEKANGKKKSKSAQIASLDSQPTSEKDDAEESVHPVVPVMPASDRQSAKSAASLTTQEAAAADQGNEQALPSNVVIKKIGQAASPATSPTNRVTIKMGERPPAAASTETITISPTKTKVLPSIGKNTLQPVPGKAEVSKITLSPTVTSQAELPKTESSKIALPKAGLPKVDLPKPLTSRAESPRVGEKPEADAGTALETVKKTAATPLTGGENKILADADKAFNQRRYKEARNMYQSFLSQSPHSPEAAYAGYRVADTLFLDKDVPKEKRYFGSIEAYNEMLNSYPDSAAAPRALFNSGVSYYKVQFFNEAKDYFSRLIATYPNSPHLADAAFYLGDSLYNIGSYKEALEVFKSFIERNPQNQFIKQAMFRLGDCYTRLKDYDKADAAFQNALTSFPDLANQPYDTLTNLGPFLEGRKEYAKARETYFERLNVYQQREDDLGSLMEKIGDTFMAQKRYDEALNMYSQALTLAPYTASVDSIKLKMADLGTQTKGLVHATPKLAYDPYAEPGTAYKEAYLKAGGTPEGQAMALKYAQTLINQGKIVESLEPLAFGPTEVAKGSRSQAAQQANMLYAKNIRQLMDTSFEKNDFARVSELYDKYYEPILGKTRDPALILHLAESNERAGLLNEAIGLYNQALEVNKDPNLVDFLRFKIAQITHQSGNQEKAVQLFSEFVKTYRKSKYYPDAAALLAELYYIRGQNESAVTIYYEMLDSEKGPSVKRARIESRLGDIFKKLNQLGNAAKGYRDAIYDYPNDIEKQEFIKSSWFRLGDVLYEQKNYPGAFKAYSDAVEKFPEADDSQWGRYMIYQTALKLEKPDKAKVALESLESHAKKGGVWQDLSKAMQEFQKQEKKLNDLKP